MHYTGVAHAMHNPRTALAWRTPCIANRNRVEVAPYTLKVGILPQGTPSVISATHMARTCTAGARRALQVDNKAPRCCSISTGATIATLLQQREEALAAGLGPRPRLALASARPEPVPAVRARAPVGGDPPIPCTHTRTHARTHAHAHTSTLSHTLTQRAHR